MLVYVAAVPPFMKNGYLVSCERTGEAVVIDPGDEVDELISVARTRRLDVQTILLTHAHLDHITGVAQAKRAFGVPVWLHREDVFLYDAIVEQGRMFGLTVEPQPPVDQFYEAGSALGFGHYVIEWHHTPGHCPGGVCLAIGRRDDDARELFVGDTLFAGSIGRTDLPGGSLSRLRASIVNVLFGYPDDTIVHSGHGPDTTIGHERRTNPYLQ
jgi:glyoxylase-like metal-dependent hydrolase (beta-lactamase superfamily II)